MASCVFCNILAGREPASFVYRDDFCAAFMDIQPINPGHLLVIPNQHADSLAELDEETGAQIFRVGQRFAAALRKSGIHCQGINLYLADGAAAGQDVFHVHLHVIPRFQGDGFHIHFSPSYYRLPERSELDDIAGNIRTNL
jgi:histidine triad (HIT) family protein